MNAGLLGAGTIGFGVCEIADAGGEISVSKVLDRRDIPELQGRLTRDIGDILGDESISAVIELLGGVEPAHKWAIDAMNAGKNVVTANKLMLSENLKELMECARKNNVSLRFSAAVGGGIPILFNLIRARRVDKITEVGGILNGTTNYMLDLMQSQGIGFSTALKLAQDAGYAEVDPTADISGSDAKCKIMLASCIAWDCMIEKKDILCEGIESVTANDIAAIGALGRRLKLIARAVKTDNNITCCVEPTIVRNDTVTANIPLVENMAYFVGVNAGMQRFTGAGAGRYATAYAVVNDLIDIARNPNAYEFAVTDRHMDIDNTRDVKRYAVRGLDIPGSDIGAGLVLTREMSSDEMHRMVKAARAEGKNVFFAGIID